MISLKKFIPVNVALNVLAEQVATQQVDPVLDGDGGKFFYVTFDYNKDGETSKRWCQLYQRNITTRNNNAISAYQISRDGAQTGPEGESYTGWRIFRLDRMSNLQVSRVPFYKPQPGFNATGNRTPSIRSTVKIAPVGTYQYKTT